MSGFTFPFAFACAQLTWDACFNFLTPYSLNLTWGVGLGLAMLGCLWRAGETDRIGWLAAAGALLGLVVLTKAEVTLAGALSSAVGLVCLAWVHKWDVGKTASRIGIFAGCALIAPVIAVGLFSVVLPFGQALMLPLGAARFLGSGQLGEMTYVRWLAGTDDPQQNLRVMLLWTAGYGGIIALMAALSMRANWVMGLIASILVAAVAVWCTRVLPIVHLSRPLPILLAIVVGGLLWKIQRRSPGAAGLVFPIALTVFAGALLARIILRANLTHYGFALTLPGMLVVIALLFGWIPTALAREPRDGWALRAVPLVAWAVMMGGLLLISRAQISQRSFPIARGADRFLADSRGKTMNEALEFLSVNSRAGDRLVAIPDASLLNYLVRMPSSVRYHNFLPPEMVLFGEDRMLAALKENPPDWIVLVHADTAIFDARFFGRDYARSIAAWIGENYLLHRQLGAAPYTGDAFGLWILKRK